MQEEPITYKDLVRTLKKMAIKSGLSEKDRKKAMDHHLAATLMHELGHNIDLSDTNVTEDRDLTTMYCRVYANAPLDYRQPSEWAAIWPDKMDEP